MTMNFEDDDNTEIRKEPKCVTELEKGVGLSFNDPEDASINDLPMHRKGEDCDAEEMRVPHPPVSNSESDFAHHLRNFASLIAGELSDSSIDESKGYKLPADGAGASVNEKDDLLRLTVLVGKQTTEKLMKGRNFLGDLKEASLHKLKLNKNRDVGDDSSIESETKKVTKDARYGGRMKVCTMPFSLTLCSNLLFVLGSLFYLWLSLEDFNWTMQNRTIPTNRALGVDSKYWMDGKEEIRSKSSTDMQYTKDLAGNMYRGGRLLGKNYESYWWKELPDDARDHAIILEYTEPLWDNELPAETEYENWAELNPRQRVAAEFFDYGEERWDATNLVNSADAVEGDDFSTGNMGHIRKGDKKTETQTSGTDEIPYDNSVDTLDSFYSSSWKNLPYLLQTAAKTLGYTKHKWDNDEQPESDYMDWNQLTFEEQRAAEIFGFDKQAWDKDGIITEDSIHPTNTVTEYLGARWKDLPYLLQSAAYTLGFTKHNWESDDRSTIVLSEWGDLTLEQQGAGIAFGYDEQTWDKEYHSLEGIIVTNNPGYTTADEKYTKADEKYTKVDEKYTKADEKYTKADEKYTKADEKYKEKELDDSEPNWNDYYWDELPKKIKKYAKILGYDKKTWDNEERVSTSDELWTDLSGKQQEAAILFGFDQRTWDEVDVDEISNSGVEDTLSVLSVEVQSIAQKNEAIDENVGDNTPVIYGDLETKVDWENYLWFELPPPIKSAASELGYDKNLWDSDGAAVTDNLHWDQLTSKQQKAAKTFGYEKTTWESALDVDRSESVTPDNNAFRKKNGDPENSESNIAINTKDWDKYSWAELPLELFNAAHLLGYNQEMWDNNESSPVDELSWAQLTPEQKEAAYKFEYDQISWDGVLDGSSSPNEGLLNEEMFLNSNENEEEPKPSNTAETDLTDDWTTFMWSELPPQIKSAAMELGYNQNLWDNDGTSSVDSNFWTELTYAQQKAALTFGYDQKSWDGLLATSAPNDTLLDQGKMKGTGEAEPSDPSYNLEAGISVNYDWDNYSWAELPSDTKSAAKLLGYNQYLWDNDEITFVDNMSWMELTTEQHQAAAKFGYDQKIWDGENGDNTSDSALNNGEQIFNIDENGSFVQNEKPDKTILENETKEKENIGESTYEEITSTDWGSYRWADLPENIVSAALSLGYNEPVWDSGAPAYTDALYWTELTPLQQEAATVFGYDQFKWDNVTSYDPSFENDTTENEHGTIHASLSLDFPEIDGADKWGNKYWSELPSDIQAAAIVLGYDETSWNSYGTVFTDGIKWAELTFEQKFAASVLGYNEDKWNNIGDTTYISNGENVVDWDEYYWSSLPNHIQAAAKVLGYDKEIWDNGETAATTNMYWSELTKEQKDAAGLLGYDQNRWDTYDNYNSETDGAFNLYNDQAAFSIGDQSMSKYAAVYSLAALCFVGTGIIDWLREKQAFHVFMVLAGICGLFSALLVDINTHTSNIFNSISVHFFLLEALNVIRIRINQKRPYPLLSLAFWIADTFFVFGALLDVVLSYLYFDKRDHSNITASLVGIVATIFWVLCSLMYTYITIAFGRWQGRSRDYGQRHCHTNSSISKDDPKSVSSSDMIDPDII